MNNKKIDREMIAENIIKAINAASIPSRGFHYIDTRNVEEAVEKISQQIARSEAAAKLYLSEVLREVFKKFDGKVVNRRFWSAVKSACYSFMPAGDVWTNYRGEKIEPCAVYLVNGFEYGSNHFARVLWNGNKFGGPSCDNINIIYGRHTDWMTCEEAEKTEYKIITGERLDASAALAVLDYEAKEEQRKASMLRDELDGGGEIVAEYIRAVNALESILCRASYDFRAAFNLGSHSTLPVTVHN